MSNKSKRKQLSQKGRVEASVQGRAWGQGGKPTCSPGGKVTRGPRHRQGRGKTWGKNAQKERNIAKEFNW